MIAPSRRRIPPYETPSRESLPRETPPHETPPHESLPHASLWVSGQLPVAHLRFRPRPQRQCAHIRS